MKKLIFLLTIITIIHFPAFTQSKPPKEEIINWIKEKINHYALHVDHGLLYDSPATAARVDENGNIAIVEWDWVTHGNYNEYDSCIAIIPFDDICSALYRGFDITVPTDDRGIDVTLKTSVKEEVYTLYVDQSHSPTTHEKMIDAFTLNIHGGMQERMVQALNDLGSYNCPKELY